MDQTPIIEIRNLSAGYIRSGNKSKTVLKDICFEVNSGELVSMAGSNGIGKSTLLKTIAGLLPPLQGRILIKGRPLEDYTRDEIARMLSIVLTGRTPSGNLKTRELVSLGRYPYTGLFGVLNDEDERKVEESMELTGTREYRFQPVHELSDGQMQKVLIARALAQDSGIILLDEPTAHLDLINKMSIMNLLKELSGKTGKAILIATHELDLAIQVSDRLILMKEDKTLATGSPEDLVLNGQIDAFIRHGGITFDPGTGKFIPVSSGGKPVGLVAPPGMLFAWTKNALERIGCRLQEGKNDITVEVVNAQDKINWTIKYPNGLETVQNIEELIQKMRNIF